MILPGKIRGNGKELADYILAKRDNERVWILEVDGKEDAHPEYLRQTIMSMQHMAELTKSKQAYFHVEITPAYGEEKSMSGKDYQRCADIMAEHLGFTDSRRVIVMHHKKGKSHAHVVFERYNYTTGKIVDNKHSRLKLVQARIAMEKEFGFKPMPLRNQNQKALKDIATKLWNNTTTGQQFIVAARKAGYMVAEGTADRPYMIVDKTGRSFNLVRQLDGIRTKEVRARLRNEKLTPEKQAIEIMRSEGKTGGAGKQQQEARPITSTKAAEKVAGQFAHNRKDALKVSASDTRPIDQSAKNAEAFRTFKETGKSATEKDSGKPKDNLSSAENLAQEFADNRNQTLSPDQTTTKHEKVIEQHKNIREVERKRVHKRTR